MKGRRWLLASGAALAGCSVLPQEPYLQRRNWPLAVRRPEALAPNPRGRVLLVRDIQAGPGLESNGLQWLQPDGSVHVDFYEQWAVPPAEAVTDDVRHWLADAGLFSAVVTPGSRMNADFVLEGELDALIADVGNKSARVAVALVLLDQRPGTTKVLLQKTERAEVPLAGTDPPAIVQAVKAALADVLRETEADVAAATR
jgi:cholesterol transport system auxiliary component